MISRNLLQSKVAAEVRTLVEVDNAQRAFRLCLTSLDPAPFGWNKFWEGGTLFSWYGETVSAEPLRLVVLEIAFEPTRMEEIRKYLTVRWEGKTPGELGRETARLLAQLGIPISDGKLGTADLNLLRRLNLDQREQPFIERWRWSGGSGYATLSDEGRFQIKPALVWTRAIEAALDNDGCLRGDIADAMLAADPDSELLALPACGASEKLIERLAFFGFGERWAGGVSLASPVGNLPKELARLFSNQPSTLQPLNP